MARRAHAGTLDGRLRAIHARYTTSGDALMLTGEEAFTEYALSIRPATEADERWRALYQATWCQGYDAWLDVLRTGGIEAVEHHVTFCFDLDELAVLAEYLATTKT